MLHLASIDVDRIAKEMDFRALQQNIMNITFCNIETEVSLEDKYIIILTNILSIIIILTKIGIP